MNADALRATAALLRQAKDGEYNQRAGAHCLGAYALLTTGEPLDIPINKSPIPLAMTVLGLTEAQAARLFDVTPKGWPVFYQGPLQPNGSPLASVAAQLLEDLADGKTTL